METEVVYLPGKDIDAKAVEDADGLIVRTRTRCDKTLLDHSRVKIVSTATIGTDHIDKNWCSEKGIKVENAPGCNAPGVAQYVLASLFKIGFDPGVQTLGIIGYGHVGSVVAAWAKQMGIKVLISDAPREDSGFEDVEYLNVDDLIGRSDAITIHVPFTKEGKYPTFHLIGEKEIEKMKPGAILVNSSRGGVVDESALKKGIRNKGLKAIVDVWENEPQIDSELLDLVEIGTPHIAGYSAEGKKRATRMALQSIAKELGVPVDLSGLECVPPKDKAITRKLIEDSYDPMEDSLKLKSNLSDFESLRNNYSYRSEPLFS